MSSINVFLNYIKHTQNKPQEIRLIPFAILKISAIDIGMRRSRFALNFYSLRVHEGERESDCVSTIEIMECRHRDVGEFLPFILLLDEVV